MAPSLHVSLSTLATVAIVRRFPRLRAVSIAWLLTIILSVCLVKQHTVVDAITGLCAAWLALRIADRLTRGSASVEAA
jgi:membrane-associated phospholipid phosphatase